MIKKFFKKSAAFIKRDILIKSSYRIALVMDMITIAASVTTFFFIAKLVNKNASACLAEYGGDYFSFVLIGLAFSSYLSTALNSFTGTISHEQTEGTTEILLLSPTPLSLILVCSSIGDFLIISIRVIGYILMGWLVFGFDISNINILSSFTALALTIISFSSIGILSAAFIIVFKRGNPINTAISGISRLLGGVLFPVTLLPGILQNFSHLLPITYALSAMRKTIIRGAGLSDIASELAALACFSIVFFTLGTVCFRVALRKAKINGSLLYS